MPHQGAAVPQYDVDHDYQQQRLQSRLRSLFPCSHLSNHLTFHNQQPLETSQSSISTKNHAAISNDQQVSRPDTTPDRNMIDDDDQDKLPSKGSDAAIDDVNELKRCGENHNHPMRKKRKTT